MRIRVFLVLFIFVFSHLPSWGQTHRNTTAEYIDLFKNTALQEMQKYKIPASITLAQGILESENGNSTLARNANNHFGIKCKAEWTGATYLHDDDAKQECFRKYKSASESYRDHSLFLTTRERYAFLFQLPITDYKGWAKGLKQAGYATAPTYAEMLIKIIEDNKLYRFDVGDTLRIIAVMIDTTSTKPLALVDTVKKVTNPVFKHDDQEDFQDIVLSKNSRRLGQINGVRFVWAHSGDSYQSIAEDFGLTVKDIALNNDQKKDYTPANGEIVFIELKKDDGPVEFHMVKAGDNMRDISQQYGMKLKSLYHKNRMKYGTEAEPGQRLYLQNMAPVY
jgi:LysM repeat protein